jgi:hypothetical protein
MFIMIEERNGHPLKGSLPREKGGEDKMLLFSNTGIWAIIAIR